MRRIVATDQDYSNGYSRLQKHFLKERVRKPWFKEVVFTKLTYVIKELCICMEWHTCALLPQISSFCVLFTAPSYHLVKYGVLYPFQPPCAIHIALSHH